MEYPGSCEQSLAQFSDSYYIAMFMMFLFCLFCDCLTSRCKVYDLLRGMKILL